MEKRLLRTITLIDLNKLHSRGGRPVWKTGTCRDNKLEN